MSVICNTSVTAIWAIHETEADIDDIDPGW